MSCSPFDLKDYFFGDVSPKDRSEVETHVAGCASCRDELHSLGATRAVLMSVPDEEPPRRIAFVSDKVFEPRWWQRVWTSAPQLGFASAAMLAVAITVHAFVPGPAPQTITASVPSAAIEAEVAKRVKTELADRVGAEVAKAVAASEQQQLAKTLELLNTRLQTSKAEQRELLLRIADYIERLEKRNSQVVRQVIYQ